MTAPRSRPTPEEIRQAIAAMTPAERRALVGGYFARRRSRNELLAPPAQVVVG